MKKSQLTAATDKTLDRARNPQNDDFAPVHCAAQEHGAHDPGQENKIVSAFKPQRLFGHGADGGFSFLLPVVIRIDDVIDRQQENRQCGSQQRVSKAHAPQVIHRIAAVFALIEQNHHGKSTDIHQPCRGVHKTIMSKIYS